jgi:regulator of sigma E protease
MFAQPPLWFIIIAFLCAIGPLVFFHELGHYWVARWFGVGAEQFSIGFGREITGWTDKRGTRWKVGWLPLGGYVRFVGDMNPASQPDPDADIPPDIRATAFHLRPWWQRFLIVLAGPVANFLLAIAIFAGFFAAFGVPTTPNIVSGIIAGSPAERAGLAVGDRIVEMDGRSTPTFEMIGHVASLNPGERVAIRILRGTEEFTTSVKLSVVEETDRFGRTFRIGRLGIPNPGRRMEQVPASQLIPHAVDKTVVLTRSMVEGLWQIISGRRSVKELGGPLKIAQIAGQQASVSWLDFASLVALISINLGFINLLPVPMLDGGHLVFYVAEGIRRRPVSERAQDWAFRGGLALLLALLLFTTVNDLASFGLFERLGRLIG